MGDLIVMSRSKAAPSRAFSAGHSAEIAFFTGVRYYRMDEVSEPTKIGHAKLVGAKLAVAKRRRSPEQRVASKRLREERRREALA